MKSFIICSGIFLSVQYSYSQEVKIPQNYSDSLTLAKSMIDQLAPSEISKQRERFIYLNRTQPSKINEDILVYLNDKFKSITK